MNSNDKRILDCFRARIATNKKSRNGQVRDSSRDLPDPRNGQVRDTTRNLPDPRNGQVRDASRDLPDPVPYQPPKTSLKQLFQQRDSTRDLPDSSTPPISLKQMFPSGPITNPVLPGGPGGPGGSVPPPVYPTIIDDPPPVGPPPPPPPPTDPVCPNYHPDHSIPGKPSQADIVRSITSYVNGKGYRHDPDGIPWIPRVNWVPWDGVTTINPCTSTKAQLMAFIFPPPGGINTMRGLRERFYEVNPFADNSNPTVAEIENWNIEVIRLFRRLLGFNQTTHPVYNDKCTYLKAAWAEERARTNYWSATYPGTLDGAAGPCTLPNSPNPHCGASFLLSPSDQAPYLCPSTMPPCTVTSGAEGISNHNTDIPWAVKMSRIIGSFLASDGIDQHTGPFVGRTYFGSAWYIQPTNPGSMVVRTKWSGNLAPTCP